MIHSLIFSSNSEANASGLLENIEEMFIYKHGDVCRSLKTLTLQNGVNRYEGLNFEEMFAPY